MKCEHVRSDLQAYSDGEVTLRTRLAIARHLRHCATCAELDRDARTLRARIRAEAPRFRAPATLHARLASLLDATPARAPGSSRRWPWLGSGALIGACLTALVWVGASTIVAQRTGADIVNAAVVAHATAAVGDRLAQVSSSDQHTVKPWLSSQLDYSPPVVDYAALGFALVGARVERLHGEPVAALVYRYRLHTIDVFVRPGWLRGQAAGSRSIRGFNAISFTAHDMDWLVVSDASAEGLAPLVHALGGP